MSSKILRKHELWFYVEKKNYTTSCYIQIVAVMLWFDVEKKNYTTMSCKYLRKHELWFDVEKKNYTTKAWTMMKRKSCGLMQKKRIIQLYGFRVQ